MRFFVSTPAILFVVLPAALLGSCGSSAPPPGPPSEALDSPSAVRAEFEAIGKALLAGENRYVGNGSIRRIEAHLERPDLPAENRILAMHALTQAYLRAGELERAVPLIERAFTLLDQEATPETRAKVLFMRGLTYLRQAEARNCAAGLNKDSCLLPLRGGGVHADPAPAARARESFQAYLQLKPGNELVHWLLNVLSMAVGDYPSAVPAAFRVPPEAFESELDIGRLENIAPQLGIDTFNQCGGVIAEDFDGDHLIDLVASTFDPLGPLTFYRNLGDGTFADLSASSRLDEQLGGLNLVAADYDDDGDVDILVLRGAWLQEDGEIRNSLLRNNGDLTFTDVTREAGLAEVAFPTQAATWADFDADGDLDLYIVNESPWEEPDRYPAELYRNEGDGTFAEIAAAAGVTNEAFGKGTTSGDYDNDGDLDIYVSNVGPNRLYRNEGDMTFVDVASELGLTQPEGRSFATWFFDYDNDGWLDLFVAAYDATVIDVVADLAGRPHNATFPRLYRNNSDGTFSDIATQAGLDHPYLPMGANFGDLDNDGWLDLYLSTGDPLFVSLMPNVMLRNDRGRRFQNITTSSGLGHIQKGHGVAFVDLDNDGDQDVYHQLGGFFPGDAYHNAFFLNPGHDRRFLTVELRGAESNSFGLGARLKVVVGTGEDRREMHRAVGAVSSFGGSPFRQEIGLGDAKRVERVEVYWPVSGTSQQFFDVPIDATIRIVEGESDFQVLSVPRFDLGAI